MKAMIKGIGSYAPEMVYNEDFEKIYGKKARAVGKLLQHQSRFNASGVFNKDALSNIEMGYESSQQAISHAQLQANDIDMIIYSSCTPDYVLPPNFSLLQEKLGIRKCIGFDLRSGCAGFGTALTIAETYICAGKAHNVLVVGADVLSTRFSEYHTYTKEMPMKVLFNYMFFGDGAGSIIVSAVEDSSDSEIFYAKMESSDAHLPYGSVIEVGGSLHPYPTEKIHKDRWSIYQAPHLSDEYLPKVLIDTMNTFVKETGEALADIDKFILPIESNRVKERVLQELPGLSEEKIISCGNEGGALINAALPLALDKAVKNNHIHHGEKVLIYAAENTKWQHALLGVRW